MIFLYGALVFAAIATAINARWLWAVNRAPRPCPTSHAWLVDNPLADLISGTRTTLDRIDIRPGQRLLDAGCGPGRLSIPAAQRVGPEGMVVSLDVQPGMIALLEKKAARKGITNIRPHLGDIAADFDLPDDSFDRAWMVTVLGEVPDPHAALRGLYRVIKPGGTLSIAETFRDPHFQRREVVRELCLSAGFIEGPCWGSTWDYTWVFSKPVGAAN